MHSIQLQWSLSNPVSFFTGSKIFLSEIGGVVVTRLLQYLKCTAFRWPFKCGFCLKLAEHSSQENGLIPSWVRLWRLSLYFVLNDFPHFWQSYRFLWVFFTPTGAEASSLKFFVVFGALGAVLPLRCFLRNILSFKSDIDDGSIMWNVLPLVAYSTFLPNSLFWNDTCISLTLERSGERFLEAEVSNLLEFFIKGDSHSISIADSGLQVALEGIIGGCALEASPKAFLQRGYRSHGW